MLKKRRLTVLFFNKFPSQWDKRRQHLYIKMDPVRLVCLGGHGSSTKAANYRLREGHDYVLTNWLRNLSIILQVSIFDNMTQVLAKELLKPIAVVIIRDQFMRVYRCWVEQIAIALCKTMFLTYVRNDDTLYRLALMHQCGLQYDYCIPLLVYLRYIGLALIYRHDISRSFHCGYMATFANTWISDSSNDTNIFQYMPFYEWHGPWLIECP